MSFDPSSNQSEPKTTRIGMPEPEDRLVQPEEDEIRDEEETALRDLYAWKFMHSLDRAGLATGHLCDRVRKLGRQEDIHALLQITFSAILALNNSPRASEVRAKRQDWPSFVPGGSPNGPLRKAWVKQFDEMEVGKEIPDLWKQSRVHLEKGKPAWLAKLMWDAIEPFRRPPTMFDQLPEVEWITAARSLPPLSEASVESWRDISLLSLEDLCPDWDFWCRISSERFGTAYNRRQQSNDNGWNAGVEKSTLSQILLDGFKAFAKLI